MQELIEQLGRHRVIPISVGGMNADNADAVADALIDGGLPLLEITLRTRGAIEAAAKLAKRNDIVIGTGTILTLDQAKASLDAGVSYLVAPGFDEEIVEFAQTNNLLMLAGATTATEITRAYKCGLRVVKFFPSEAAGGVAAMNLLAGPFAGLRFVPTGGISNAMLPKYFASPAVLAVGQGSLITTAALAEKNYDAIRAAARSAVDVVRESQIPSPNSSSTSAGRTLRV